MVLTDNVGIFLAGLFREPTSVVKNVGGFTNTSGGNFSGNIYKIENDPLALNAVAQNNIQIGKGTTPATRQDVTIESPFTNGGIEDGKVLSAVEIAYVSALGKVSKGTIISPTFGSGSITEVVKFTTLLGNDCIWSRDVIPPANFINGESVNVEEVILI